jgi:hypothetical protein
MLAVKLVTLVRLSSNMHTYMLMSLCSPCCRFTRCPPRRYYWFMLAFELVTLIGLSVLAAVGLLAASALSWLAWLTVLTLLFIQGADTFLAIKDIPYGLVGSDVDWD